MRDSCTVCMNMYLAACVCVFVSLVWRLSHERRRRRVGGGPFFFFFPCSDIDLDGYGAHFRAHASFYSYVRLSKSKTYSDICKHSLSTGKSKHKGKWISYIPTYQYYQKSYLQRMSLQQYVKGHGSYMNLHNMKCTK